MRIFTIPADKLEDVVLGRDRTYARAEAMAQLAASDRPGRESILARVLENDQEPRRYKAPAAVALGRIATAASENILLSRLNNVL